MESQHEKELKDIGKRTKPSTLKNKKYQYDYGKLVYVVCNGVLCVFCTESSTTILAVNNMRLDRKC